jgi:hypothetical protein
MESQFRKSWWLWAALALIALIALLYPFCRSAVINCIMAPCPQQTCEPLVKRIIESIAS